MLEKYPTKRVGVKNKFITDAGMSPAVADDIMTNDDIISLSTSLSNA